MDPMVANNENEIARTNSTINTTKGLVNFTLRHHYVKKQVDLVPEFTTLHIDVFFNFFTFYHFLNIIQLIGDVITVNQNFLTVHGKRKYWTFLCWKVLIL